MTTIKTQQNDASIEDFIDTLDDPQKREDCRVLVELFARASKQTPRMWGTGIVGCGKHHYQYANGKPGEMCKCTQGLPLPRLKLLTRGSNSR